MNAVDVRELLPLYALGILEADEAAVVERAVANDPALAAELDMCLDTVGDLDGLVTPIEPAREVETRLMASVGGGRFEHMSSRMAGLFDVSVDRARELLALVERTASWEIALPGIHLVHFEGGPSTVNDDCGFVRIDPGHMFPEHSHLGQEITIILSGRLRDRDGRVLSPGDELVHDQTITHHLEVDGDEPCLYATRASNGITIAGVRAVAPGRQPK